MRLIDRSSIRSRGDFDTILRGQPLLTSSVMRNGLTVLLCGAPGVGKTTVGLYLLNLVHEQARNQGKNADALLLSLVESSEQLESICRLYGFDFAHQRPPILTDRYAAGEEPDLGKIANKAKLPLAQGDLVFIDGISALGTSSDDRQHLLSFLDEIKRRRLIAILVAEEYGDGQDHFLEYGVDAIIRLGVDPPSFGTGDIFRRRWIEIAKLRWHDYHMGPHAFRLQDAVSYPDDPGVALFPSARCLIDERRRRLSRDPSPKSSVRRRPRLASGVAGFDGMVKAHADGAFREGERSLLIGPSGSGKFRFGTQFLAASEPAERAICVSFGRTTSDLATHFAALREISMPDDTRRAVERVSCEALHINPTAGGIEEIFGAIHNLLDSGPGPVRLFVDGVSVLRCRFSDDARYELFLRSLLDLIRTFPRTTTLLSYQTPRVFASYSEIDIPASDLFSTVIGFNFQEQANRVVPGIVILKSSAAAHDTALRVPRVADGEYTVDPKAGWSRVALLSGVREQVHEEHPFVKLFFENRSENEVLKIAFDDFRKHYPANYDFHMVGRHNPQPTHWSFRGYAGPGHSNTKLVQLRKYVMDMLRDDELLLQVPREVEDSLIRVQFDRFESDFVWADCTEAEGEPRVMIPSYCDVGVLVYQQDGLQGQRNGLQNARVEEIGRSWNQMIELAKDFTPSEKFPHLFIIPNIVGDHRNFVSFFFELCWTHGWDFPATRTCPMPGVLLEELTKWVDGEYFAAAVQLLHKLIDVGRKTNSIPNPNIGGHYHRSVFGRRWFSKTLLLPSDAEARAAGGDSPFQLGIAPLPGVRSPDGTLLPGISNVDLYALGVIREALAPETAWMLASTLVDSEVDVWRVKRKRGLPVSRRKFETRLVQENLCAPPPSPEIKLKPEIETKEKFYETNEHRSLFAQYGSTLTSILTPDAEGRRRFRRTTDIRRFFRLEELLARELPRMFEKNPTSESEIKEEIKKGLLRIYAAE